MQGQLPAWLNLPCSAALPFGAFEAVLGHHNNAAAALAMHKVGHLAVLSNEQLANIRSEVMRLEAPAEVRQQVTKALQQSGEHSTAQLQPQRHIHSQFVCPRYVPMVATGCCLPRDTTWLNENDIWDCL